MGFRHEIYLLIASYIFCNEEYLDLSVAESLEKFKESLTVEELQKYSSIRDIPHKGEEDE